MGEKISCCPRKQGEGARHTCPEFGLLLLDRRLLSGERMAPGLSLGWERRFPSFARELG